MKRRLGVNLRIPSPELERAPNFDFLFETILRFLVLLSTMLTSTLSTKGHEQTRNVVSVVSCDFVDRILRILSGVALLALLFWAAVGSSRAGLSRRFLEYGSAAGSLATSERALQLNAGDPEAHYGRALCLQDLGRTGEAVLELEQAASLRPDDYFFWQELGRAREEAGNTSGAVAALQAAIRLAPYYAQPHWQLGNVLLRNNETETAFREMRLAATSDPELFPSLLNLASAVYEGNAESIAAATQPQSDIERLLLVRFLLKQDKNAALEVLSNIRQIAPEDRAALVTELIAAEEFALAYRVWSAQDIATDGGETTLVDGGFESSITFNNSGFGWQPSRRTPNAKVLLDTNAPALGERSLRVEYSGNFDAKIPVLSQLLPVAPGTRYRLTFSARTEKLFSAGLPVVAVREALGDTVVIAESDPLPAGTNTWRTFTVELQTGAATKAVTINIQRQACNVKPCPLVGRAWFDEFQLLKQ